MAKFTEAQMVERLQAMYPDAQVIVQDVCKTNGSKRGIQVSMPGTNISPVFYVESFGDSTLDEACEIVRKHLSEGVDINVGFINNFDSVKDKIRMKLVNAKWNKEFLKDKPSLPFLDLMIMFYVKVKVADGNGSIAVTDKLANMWNTDAETLFEIARKNEAPVIGGLNDFIPVGEDAGMTIVSNKDKNFGAGAILVDEVRDRLTERFGKFYVIPSSVHEVIVLPSDMVDDRSVLDAMVNDVNEGVVSLDERLSDHAYYFDGERFCA